MIRGSCLCGGIQFGLTGELTPIQPCHATRCRKATGAAYSPELLAKTSEVEWECGEELLQVFTAPLLDAPPAYRKAFCGSCGSPMPVAIEGTPYSILQAGVLDDDPQTRPFRHAYVGQKACWHTITDGLPQYPAQPPLPSSIDPAKQA